MSEHGRNATKAAQSLIIAEIKHCKRIPRICKNLMIEVVQAHMGTLGQSLGCIELAAHRADAHGIETDKTPIKIGERI